MSWLASIFVALLTAAAGAVASGAVAALCVDWYHVSSREGGAGYFVLFLGLFGLIAGGVIGLIAARYVAAHADPSFFKALGYGLGVIAGVAGVIAGAARLLADVPPTIDGETLFLQVEIRWPAEQVTPPAADTGLAALTLHSIPAFSHTVRASARGALWLEDAHQVDGRWVAPGAVEVFTSRGSKALDVELGSKHHEGFLLRLPAYPTKRDTVWTDWLPRDGRGGPPRAKGLTYRYRVQRASEPIRSESVGRFEVLTVASQFYETQVQGKSVIAASARFRLRLAGNPVSFGASSDSAAAETPLDEVAVLPGPAGALLAHTDPSDTPSQCFLVVADGVRPRVDSLPDCGGVSQAQVLTSDNARFHEAQKVALVPGRINRETFAEHGVYLLGNATFDTRSLSFRRFTPDSALVLVPAVAPLGLSPDGRSLIRFGWGQDENGIGSESLPRLGVTDVVSNQSYLLAIDPARMRFPNFEALDPAWVDHHFTWERGQDGIDRLVERKHFVPIPFRGAVTTEDGGYQYYRIEKAGSALRVALLDFLVAEFRAERVPADSDAYEMPVKIDGRTVNVAASSDFGYVSVSMERGTGDTTLVTRIAERFDSVLATGKYDSLFAH